MHGNGPGGRAEAEKVVPTPTGALHAVTRTVSPGLQAREEDTTLHGRLACCDMDCKPLAAGKGMSVPSAVGCQCLALLVQPVFAHR